MFRLKNKQTRKGFTDHQPIAIQSPELICYRCSDESPIKSIAKLSFFSECDFTF